VESDALTFQTNAAEKLKMGKEDFAGHSLVLRAFAEGDATQRTLAALAPTQRRAWPARLRFAGHLRRLVAETLCPRRYPSL
jgi:hypothetical protein